MIVLKISYVQILLKDEAGIQQLLKILSKGIQVRMYGYEEPPRMEIVGPIELGMEVVSGKGWRVCSEDGQPADPGTELIPINGSRLPARTKANGKAPSARFLFPFGGK